MNKYVVIAVLLIVGLCGAYGAYPQETQAMVCALPGVTCALPHHDVQYYLAHPDERAAKIASAIAEAVNDPGNVATHMDANYTNASMAEVIARTRADRAK
jgi:hypothetical protein